MQDFAGQEMTRLNAYRARATDILSALLLLLAVMLAGGHGPLTVQAAAVASAQSATDAGRHRSAPAVTEQQLLASEAEGDEAATWGDGNPKVFPPSGGLDLPVPTADADHTAQTFVPVSSVTASPFDARAPPAIS